jgi:hypothetical protein
LVDGTFVPEGNRVTIKAMTWAFAPTETRQGQHRRATAHITSAAPKKNHAASSNSKTFRNGLAVLCVRMVLFAPRKDLQPTT